MKTLLTIALCALFAVHAAEARTLYVNASRPNNKGNGLKAKTAKKTIQAAINIAKKGDTILVYPGTYPPIKTNNKKITIKSVKGKGKTKIAGSSDAEERFTVAMLGKPCVMRHYYNSAGGDYTSYTVWKSPTDSTGMSTTLVGFIVDGGDYEAKCFAGITGGTVKSSTVRYVRSDGEPTSVVRSSKLVSCVLSENKYGGSGGCFAYCSTFVRCKITGNGGTSSSDWTPFFDSSSLVNCLVADNMICPTAWGYLDDSYVLFFDLQCEALNCTIANNRVQHSSYQSVFCWESRFYNCILRGNTSQRVWEAFWDSSLVYGPKLVHNYEAGYFNTYKNTDKANKNPKFVDAANGNYKLRKGSYAINAGKLTKAQKKRVGSKDLAGRKRIRGKAIDRGCYEY